MQYSCTPALSFFPSAAGTPQECDVCKCWLFFLIYQGWHETPYSIPFPMEAAVDDAFLKEVAPFCVRMMAILKHTSLPLPILTLPQGEQLCKNFEEVGTVRVCVCMHVCVCVCVYTHVLADVYLWNELLTHLLLLALCHVILRPQL